MTSYRALTGLDYKAPDGSERRVEPGDVADDIPVKSVPWLLRQGHIEKVDDVEGGDD